MSWATIIALIAKEGLHVAVRLWELWSSGKEPTKEDIDALKILSLKTPRSQMMEAFARNNIDSSSPDAVRMLDLLPK